jgi:hypothetical protein
MAAAGVSAVRYSPEWLEEQYRCRLPGECTAEEVAAGLRLHWWGVGLAGVAVVVGVALLVWSRSSAPRAPTVRRLPVAGHAAAAGAVVAALLLAISVPGLIAVLFLGAPAAVAAVTGLWLVQARLVSTLHRSFAGRTSARETAAVGPALSAAALGGTGWLVAQDTSPFDPWWTPLVVEAGAVALLVALVRLLRDPLPERHRAGHLRGLAVTAVAVLAGVGVVTTAMVLREPDWPMYASTPSSIPPGPEPEPEPTPTPEVVEPLSPPPAAGVTTPCSETDLDFAVVGFDGAMGARAASLQAINVSSRSCWVEGTPIVVLLQGGRPLNLQVGPGQTPQGGPAEVQRVGIAPGGTALALLTWRSYGGWADSETPQSLTAALDATSTLVPAEVAGASGAAPFDIADGGAWAIAPWAPPWS